jgi:hypothetical protein
VRCHMRATSSMVSWSDSGSDLCSAAAGNVRSVMQWVVVSLSSPGGPRSTLCSREEEEPQAAKTGLNGMECV